MDDRQKRLLIAASVVGLAAVIAAIVVATRPSNGRSKAGRTGAISGLVTDPAGHGVAHIAVTAYVSGTNRIAGEASTGLDGTYRELNLTTGSYDLFFTPSGSTGSWLSGWYPVATSQAQAKPVKVTAPKNARADIRLNNAATITGKVTDTSGHPISGVGVWAYVSGSAQIAWEATTAADGSYRELNLKTGTYQLLYFLSGSQKTAWYKGATSQAGATPVNVESAKTLTIDITVQPGS